MSVDLRLGDCLDILPTLADKSVDAIIADVPYGTTACKWDVIIPLDKMWEQVKRLCKGAFVTTASQPFTSVLIMSNLDWFKYELIWNKTMPSGFLHAKNKPMKKHENVVVFSPASAVHKSQTKNRMTYNPIMGKGKPYKKTNDPRVNLAWSNMLRPSTNKPVTNINMGERYPVSVLDFSNGNNHNEHPTQKPVALYEYLIKTYTNAGDTVLDFCMGSGTTGVACVNTGRNFIGIEKQADYFAIAERRIQEAQQQMVMPL